MLILFLVPLLSLQCVLSVSKSQTNRHDDDAFLTWFLKNGGMTNSINIEDYRDQGRGIMALEDVTQYQEVMRVPPQLIISVANLLSSHNSLNIAIATSFLSSDDAVIASLLLEDWKGSKSFFAPYLAVLPAYVTSLLHFTYEELDYLQDPEFMQQIILFQAGTRKSYRNLIAAVAPFWPEDSTQNLTYDRYLWAATIVNSRGLRFRGEIYLVPLADMFNYLPHPVTRDANSGEFFLLHHELKVSNNESGPSLTVFADRAQSAGNQLFEDYGDNSDKIYLQYHGFVPSENPFRCVVLTAPRVPVGANPLLRKVLDQLRFPLSKSPSQCVDVSGKLVNSLVHFIAALSFDEKSLSSCSAALSRAFEGAKDNGYWAGIMSECGFTAISDAVHSAIEPSTAGGMLNQFSAISLTTVSSTPGSQRSKTAVRYIQEWIRNTIPPYPTSISDDELLLFSLENEALHANEFDEFSDTPDQRSRAHKTLAVKYRLHSKILYRDICRIYGVDFSADVRDAASGAVKGTPKGLTKPWGPESVSIFSDSQVPVKDKIKLFNDWFLDAGPAVAKVRAVEIPLVRIGTVATEDLEGGDPYLAVPPVIIMDSISAASDPTFGRFVESLRSTFKQTDDFHELLLFLLHERLVKHKHSKYWPYIRLLPIPGETDAPTSWSVEEIRERLLPSVVSERIESHRNRTEGSYHHIKKVPEIVSFFPPGVITLENYKWASEVLDSRSIWWEGRRHLVPMLDFVNCKQGPLGSRVHTTQVEMLGGVDAAVTRAAWDFKQGEELFENYGQPNHIYFTYHGFSLSGPSSNNHDCVHMEMTLTPQEADRVPWDSENVRAIAQDLNLRSRGAYTECLTETIPPGVWLFLSLKTTKNTKKWRKCTKSQSHTRYGVYDDQPTLETIELLLRLVKERVAVYESYEQPAVESRRLGAGSHRASASFLLSELTILNSIAESLHRLRLASYADDSSEL